MSSIDLYYFTGSGNSLYVANELQKRLPESRIIPIVSILDKETIVASEKTVGIIFPIHAMTLPIPVKKFIKKLDVRSSEYIFAIATRGGTVSNAFTEIDKVLSKSGRSLDSYCYMDMASNDPKFKDWRPETKARMADIEAMVQYKLDSIQKVVINKEKSREKDSAGVSFHYAFPLNILMEKIIQTCMIIVEITGANNYFYSDHKCSGCGTCQKACPSGKIRLVNGKPVWQNDVKCFFCYACVNYCPKKAVQIKSKVYMKSYTEMNERYPHPYATVDDIARQKLIKELKK
jgi:ferredoxin/flavodoxin